MGKILWVLCCLLMISQIINAALREREGRQFFRPRRPLPSANRRGGGPSPAEESLFGIRPERPGFLRRFRPEQPPLRNHFGIGPQVGNNELSKRKLLLPIISEGYASTNFQGGASSSQSKDLEDVEDLSEGLDLVHVPDDDDLTHAILVEEATVEEITTTTTTTASIATTTTTVTTTPTTTTTTVITTTTITEEPLIEEESPYFPTDDLNIEVNLQAELDVANRHHQTQKSGFVSSVETVPAHDNLPSMPLPTTNIPPVKNMIQVFIPKDGGEVILQDVDDDDIDSGTESEFYEPPRFNTDETIYQAGYQQIEIPTHNGEGFQKTEFHEDRPPFKLNPLAPDFYPLGKPPKPQSEEINKELLKEKIESGAAQSSSGSSFFNFFNFWSPKPHDKPPPPPPPPQKQRKRPFRPHPRPGSHVLIKVPPPGGPPHQRPFKPRTRHYRPQQEIPQRPNFIDGQHSPNSERLDHEFYAQIPEIQTLETNNRPLQMTSQPVIGLPRVPPGRKQAPFLSKQPLRPPFVPPPPFIQEEQEHEEGDFIEQTTTLPEESESHLQDSNPFDFKMQEHEHRPPPFAPPVRPPPRPQHPRHFEKRPKFPPAPPRIRSPLHLRRPPPPPQGRPLRPPHSRPVEPRQQRPVDQYKPIEEPPLQPPPPPPQQQQQQLEEQPKQVNRGGDIASQISALLKRYLSTTSQAQRIQTNDVAVKSGDEVIQEYVNPDDTLIVEEKRTETTTTTTTENILVTTSNIDTTNVDVDLESFDSLSAPTEESANTIQSTVDQNHPPFTTPSPPLPPTTQEEDASAQFAHNDSGVSLDRVFSPSPEKNEADWFVLDPANHHRRLIESHDDDESNSFVDQNLEEGKKSSGFKERTGTSSMSEATEVAKVTGALLQTFGDFIPSKHPFRAT